MGPGDGMGIIVALSNTYYPLSAEAVTDCLTLRWDYASTIRLMEQYPSLALNGLRLVAGRFKTCKTVIASCLLSGLNGALPAPAAPGPSDRPAH